MIEVRTISPGEIDQFAAVGVDDAAAFAGQLRSMLDARATRLDWCFVALLDGEPVARACFAADEPPAQAPTEMYLFGLALDWQREGSRDAARVLLAQALPVIARIGPPIDARVNQEVHADADERRSLLENAGFGLFQEKTGYYWQSGDVLPVGSGRLTFRSLEEAGRDEFVAVLARGPAGTLDRNDRYYYELTGPVGWATVMMGYLEPGDERTWKLAYDGSGAAVGYVMLSGFDDQATGTIVHIGVVPEQRGRGYVDDLLAETTADAVARGFRAILSDADVLNTPMGAAFERAGHRRGVRPWHTWHYRFPAP
jgi:ribosomal protein S18 acetylase RimI-like enzyme